jgi:argininosuccinate lyase
MRQQPSDEYRGYRNAGIRFTEEMSPELQRDREEAESGSLAAYHMYDKAHVLALTEAGIVPMPVGQSILVALRQMEARGVVEVRSEVGGGMHSGELYLIRTLGEEVGGWAHLARSSADLGAVGDRVTIRQRTLQTMSSLMTLAEELVGLADREAETLMPIALHWQQIEPMTLGQYLAGMVESFMRDVQRGQQSFARINVSPAGAMVHSGSSFPVPAERIATLMGFGGVMHSWFDAFRDWDFTRDAYGFLAPLSAHLTILGEDLAYWTGSDQQFIHLADRYLSSSSALMQIRSATPPSLIRGVQSMVVGGMMTAYMTDATGSHMALFPRRFALPQLFDGYRHLIGVLDLLPNVLHSATINRSRAREASLAHMSTMADLAAALVRHREIPWRSAHQICGILVRHCEAESRGMEEIDPDALDRAAMEYFDRPAGLTQEQISAALDADTYIRARTMPGGSAPATVRLELARLGSVITDHRTWIANEQAAIAAAEAELDRSIDALIRTSEVGGRDR